MSRVEGLTAVLLAAVALLIVGQVRLVRQLDLAARELRGVRLEIDRGVYIRPGECR